MFMACLIKQRTQPFSLPCRYFFLAFERLPLLSNDSAFTKNVDSGNCQLAAPPPPPPAAAEVAIPAVDVSDVATAAVDAANVGAAAIGVVGVVAVAADVATGAFLRLAFDFFPMAITIIRLGTVDAAEELEYSAMLIVIV